MPSIIHGLIGSLPFEWAGYGFMRHALLAVILVSPLFALVGTMVIANRMAFFSDVLGHSALTGIAIGVVLGLGDPFWAMTLFAVILAVAVNLFKGATRAASDTVLGVFFALTVALGVVLLSRGGGFARYTSYLIGDILAVDAAQIARLAAFFTVVLLYWTLLGNRLFLVSLNPSLARSRGVAVFWVETSFTVLLALLVILSIRLVGILIINSLLILPAAAARILARSLLGYTLWAIAISLFSGIGGLIVAYYWGTASGATIVLLAAACYGAAVMRGYFLNR